MADDSPYGPPPGADDSALSAGMAAVAAAAQGAMPSGLDKRAPRFSWTPAYEATFFRSLCESVQLGLRENHSFKPQAWDRAAAALRDKHGAFPNKAHLVNKSDNARKKFRLWRGLREHPDFLYNPVTRTVTATEDAWKEHIEKEPLSRSLRGRPFEHEEYMEILYPDVIGSGGAPKRIMKPRRKGPDNIPGEEPDNTPGTAVLDLAVDAYGNTTARPTPTSTPATARPQQQNTVPRQPTTTATATAAATAVPATRALASNGSSTALTPPEDTPATHARKRFGPDLSAHFNADKRRRGAGGLTHHETGLIVEEGLTAVAEALKISRLNQSPRWPEQALEIFFREFADEDLDLQIKIAEKALTDENKAMVFVKMPPAVRKHWVSRLREVHARSGGGVAQA